MDSLGDLLIVQTKNSTSVSDAQVTCCKLTTNELYLEQPSSFAERPNEEWIRLASLITRFVYDFSPRYAIRVRVSIGPDVLSAATF